MASSEPAARSTVTDRGLQLPIRPPLIVGPVALPDLVVRQLSNRRKGFHRRRNPQPFANALQGRSRLALRQRRREVSFGGRRPQRLDERRVRLDQPIRFDQVLVRPRDPQTGTPGLHGVGQIGDGRKRARRFQ